LHEISPGGIPPLAGPAAAGRASTPIALFAKNILKIVDTSQVSDFSKQLVITNIWTVTTFFSLAFYGLNGLNGKRKSDQSRVDFG
jgi:hypothetical protein